MKITPDDLAKVDNCLDQLFSQSFPTTDYELNPMREIDSIVDGIVKSAETEAEITTMGKSWGSRDIRLVSFNKSAPKHAVFLAYVHANEPNGWPTLHLLASQLAKSGNPISSWFPDVGFHLVFVTDPDGLELNSGFYDGPRTVLNYLLNYYRPSLADTAIYTFPFDYDGHSFNDPTPGCEALMEIFQTYKPFFVNELHACEFGAKFYSSFPVPTEKKEGAGQLFDSISPIIEKYYGVPWNDIMPPNVMENVEEKLKKTGKLAGGASTIDYARQFTPAAQVLNIELGQWHNPKFYAKKSDDYDDAIDFYVRVMGEGMALYPPYFAEWSKDFLSNPLLSGNVAAKRFLDAFSEKEKTLGKTPDLSKTPNSFVAAGGHLVLLLRNYTLLMRFGQSIENLYQKAGKTPPSSYPEGISLLNEFISTNWAEAESTYASGNTPASFESIARVLVSAGLYGLQASYVTNFPSS